MRTVSGLRGLPIWDPIELERSTGSLWIVRTFVTFPLTSLGLLASLAAVLTGSVLTAVAAVTTTVLILVSLHRDTQLTKAAEQLRRGAVDAAEQSMLQVARSRSSTPMQRHRARTCLAAIAWLRGDHSEALKWTRARLHGATRSGSGMPADEEFLTRASEVQLLVLLGDETQARTRLEQLPPAPPGDRYGLAAATCRLLLAFSEREVEGVRPWLPQWRDLCERADEHGLATALVAWAHDAAGDTERSVPWVHRARALIDLPTLRRQAPTVFHWLDAYDDRALRYR